MNNTKKSNKYLGANEQRNFLRIWTNSILNHA